MNYKEKREAAGLRQTQVADLLKVSNTTVCMWEVGKSAPRAELLPKIAALYGCTVDELLSPPAGDKGQ